VQHTLVSQELAEDPTRTLHLGPNRAADVLEIIVVDLLEGPAVVHAMALRARYHYLLEGGRS